MLRQQLLGGAQASFFFGSGSEDRSARAAGSLRNSPCHGRGPAV